MALQETTLIPLVLGQTTLLPLASAAGDEPTPAKTAETSRGLHVINYKSDADLDTLGSQVPKLAELGLNVLVVEIDYSFHFRTYPKLRQGSNPITPEGAAKFAAVCRKNGALAEYRPLVEGLPLLKPADK
jgi:hypothetical protein